MIILRTVHQHQFGWKIQQRLDTDVDGDLEVIKRYRLAPLKGEAKTAGQLLHHLQFELEFVNHGAKPLPIAFPNVDR